jgi:DNA primase catalytic core
MPAHTSAVDPDESLPACTRSDIVRANTIAWRWWWVCAHTPKLQTHGDKWGYTADTWLAQERGIDPKALTAAAPDGLGSFQIGWAPSVRNASPLLEVLRAFSVSDRVIQAAGLCVPPYQARPGDDLVDGFKARVMFPIRDASADIVGFTGRIARPTSWTGAVSDRIPKYKNSPSNAAFHKGRILYGGYEATRMLTATDTPPSVVVLCEGPVDVLAFAAAGIPAVATCGTAFTVQQASWLNSLALSHGTRIVIGFDSDTAGLDASKKARTLLHTAQLANIRSATDPMMTDTDIATPATDRSFTEPLIPERTQQ